MQMSKCCKMSLPKDILNEMPKDEALYCFTESHPFDINHCITISYAHSKENGCVTQRQRHAIESNVD